MRAQRRCDPHWVAGAPMFPERDRRTAYAVVAALKKNDI
jgi:hypothetical protein